MVPAQWYNPSLAANSEKYGLSDPRKIFEVRDDLDRLLTLETKQLRFREMRTLVQGHTTQVCSSAGAILPAAQGTTMDGLFGLRQRKLIT